MVRKSVITIVAVVVLVAIVVGASQTWGYTRYGVFYNTAPTWSAPGYVYPYGSYFPYQYAQYYGSAYVPYYSYPYYPSNYGSPMVSYPAATSPQGRVGQLCGSIGGSAYGCVYGLVCDYTKTGITAVGICSQQSDVTTYPNQIATYNVPASYYYNY